MDNTQSVDDTAVGDPPRRRSRRGAWTAGAAAMAVLLGGAFAYFNTNVLNSGRICHGWVTPDEAARALGGGLGRVSASEDSATTCTIRQAGWLPGQDKRLSLRSVTEQAGFPFRRGTWEISADRHVMSGGTHGAYDAYGGWALLPAACAKSGDSQGASPVLHASVTSQDTTGDADGMRDLLAAASRALIDGSAGCAAPGYGDAVTRTLAPSPARAADLDKVCGIAGFQLAKAQGPTGRRVIEQVIGSPDRGSLYCDLSFDGDKDGAFAHLAVVSDPALAAAFTGRDVNRAECAGRATVFALDLRYFDASERAATHLPDAAGFTEEFTEAAGTAMRCA
ncbi:MULTISPECIES: hypothetical protein [unclassified Streptomyces]|uniref:hypothetical protein n=1 Tax=unclassified Streptomyces TaxID=2593676 RepID=UPI001F049D16|nr:MULTISPECIES: hypothetical protein [unclassified Streptomyces]MCH0563534.1 hypothetical protein [Streptomyces sp. MUM 2J]MCH0572489.1 hypothetical protein [Streptomyces sp. MUM 136J]